MYTVRTSLGRTVCNRQGFFALLHNLYDSERDGAYLTGLDSFRHEFFWPGCGQASPPPLSPA